MQSVTIKKAELLAALTENRTAHRAIFLEAQEGYRVEVIKQLDEFLKDAREGRKITSCVEFQEPIDQTKDYDRAIKMLEMSIDDEIKLSEQDFRAYVMDDWSWKEQFLFSNSAYSNTAMSLLAQ